MWRLLTSQHRQHHPSSSHFLLWLCYFHTFVPWISTKPIVNAYHFIICFRDLEMFESCLIMSWRSTWPLQYFSSHFSVIFVCHSNLDCMRCLFSAWLRSLFAYEGRPAECQCNVNECLRNILMVFDAAERFRLREMWLVCVCVCVHKGMIYMIIFVSLWGYDLHWFFLSV